MTYESAFGIDHVTKSYMPGKGYIAATKLTSTQRKVIGLKAQGKTIKLKSPKGDRIIKPSPNRMKNAPSATGRKIYEKHEVPNGSGGHSGKRGTLTRVMASRHETGLPHGVEGFSMPDGRGGGRVVIHDDVTDFKATAKHEMAHISPRRNPIRMRERLADPVRSGREEGRADFVGYGRQTTGQYPGNAEFKSGYNEVQGKMAAAAYRKKLRAATTTPLPGTKRKGFLRRKP